MPVCVSLCGTPKQVTNQKVERVWIYLDVPFLYSTWYNGVIRVQLSEGHLCLHYLDLLVLPIPHLGRYLHPNEECSCIMNETNQLKKIYRPGPVISYEIRHGEAVFFGRLRGERFFGMTCINADTLFFRG